MTCGTRTRPGW